MLKMTFGIKTVFVFIVISVYLAESSKREHLTNYEQLYEIGMDAYRQEKWSKCSTFFQNAIEDYYFVKNTLIDCRLQCKTGYDHLPRGSISAVFHQFLVSSNCLRRCKKKLANRAEEEISFAVDKKFEDRAPYNYLQFCLFKLGNVQKAASASFTYFITHQDDTRTIETLEYYKKLPNVQESDFKDLERKPYQKAYVKALNFYNGGLWADSAAWFEEALALYFIEEERCRASCEKGFTHNGSPDFVSAVADHYVAVIVCQQKCVQKLSTFGMEELENFVSEHYNYLQFSYYEANNFEKAMESIASYLLFRPNDEEMLRNRDYYMKTLRYKDVDFVPSQAAVEYVKLWKQIDESLDFVREHYILPNEEITDNDDDYVLTKTPASAMNEDVNRKENMKQFEQFGIKLMLESKQLKGLNRFVADNFIREDQCQALADIARSQETNENGIQQIDLQGITQLVSIDISYEISLRLLLRASDVMKSYMASYFNQSDLKIKEVKVVCRSASMESENLPDGCIPQEDGSCDADANVNFAQYRILAYLTDLMDDTGQFYFMDKENNVQSSVVPRCGRLLGYSTSNRHGVNFSWKKERCALIVSLTSQSSPFNAGILEAKELLERLETEKMQRFTNVDTADILQQFYDQGVRIVLKSEDLGGGERFVADGLSTKSECDTLIQFAKHTAITGSGYHGNISPHTEHEIFSGLDVFQAGELIDAGSTSATTLQMLLDMSEHARLLVEKYLNLTKPLYFDYTHLVCRTAIPSDADDREGYLSHPVHSDNCMIQVDGSCLQGAFAYTQRHYSALLYLNDDFEGGQFFFAHRNKSEQVSLQPHCGRLVAFNAGEYHGVKAVKVGQRCAIAMWYTHDPNFVEVSRLHVQKRLEKILQHDVLQNKLKNGAKDPVTNSDLTNENVVINENIPSEHLDDIDKGGHDEL